MKKALVLVVAFLFCLFFSHQSFAKYSEGEVLLYEKIEIDKNEKPSKSRAVYASGTMQFFLLTG